MVSLIYGTGIRLMECLDLRVQDIDFSQCEILIRSGKGNKDRITMLPASLKTPLLRHLEKVKEIHAHGRLGSRSASIRPGSQVSKRLERMEMAGITCMKPFSRGLSRKRSA